MAIYVKDNHIRKINKEIEKTEIVVNKLRDIQGDTNNTINAIKGHKKLFLGSFSAFFITTLLSCLTGNLAVIIASLSLIGVDVGFVIADKIKLKKLENQKTKIKVSINELQKYQNCLKSNVLFINEKYKEIECLNPNYDKIKDDILMDIPKYKINDSVKNFVNETIKEDVFTDEKTN